MMLRKLRNIRFLSYFKFFYKYLGSSVLFALGLSLVVGLLDGIGLTMFLPLIQAAESGSTAVSEDSDLGALDVVLEGMASVGLEPTLVTILFVMLFFFAMKGVAAFTMQFYRAVLNQRFANKIRLKNMQLLAGYDYSEFSRTDSGSIQNTLSAEVVRVNIAYFTYFSMLQFLIMMLVYVVLAYIANPKFAVIVAIGGLLSNLAFSKIYRNTKAASRKITSEMNSFQGFLIQSVASFKFLKATNLIEKYKAKVDQSIISIEKQQRRVGVMNAIASAAREPLVMGIVICAILVQVLVFKEGIGRIILSLLFFYRGLSMLNTTQNYYNQFLGVSGSVENMKEFMGNLQDFQENPGHLPFSGLSESIEVRNLDFSYGEIPVLHDVNLHIDRYETVGIVGESGSGKTTLVNLICGLIPVKPGYIYVDGVDISDIDKADYRSHIGYVTQEAQVFADTIYNNVSFWDDPTEKNVQKVRKALQLAHALEFVVLLPDGLDTEIGINGVNLSGGQRQRISIARELYRKVDLLILDEATSALDSQSEKLIQENIDTLKGSLTMLVIAHRLSTIRKADKIIFLKNDGQFEVGTFESLQKSSEKFRNMVDLQMV